MLEVGGCLPGTGRNRRRRGRGGLVSRCGAVVSAGRGGALSLRAAACVLYSRNMRKKGKHITEIAPADHFALTYDPLPIPFFTVACSACGLTSGGHCLSCTAKCSPRGIFITPAEASKDLAQLQTLICCSPGGSKGADNRRTGREEREHFHTTYE